MTELAGQLVEMFLFPIELLLAALIYVRSRQRQTGASFKITTGAAVYLLLAAVSHYLPNFLQFAAVYGLTVVLELWCMQVKPISAIFDITCAYATQHLAYQLANIAASFWGLNSILQTAPLQLPFLAAVYLAAAKLIAPVLQDMEELVLDKVRPTAVMVLMLFVATVLSSLSYLCTQRGEIQAMYMITCLYAALCCVFILWVQLDIRRQLLLRRELDFQRQIWLQSKQQYQMSRENIDLINQKCHDLKKQIKVLREYCNKAQQEDFVENIGRSISIYDSSVRTGNEVIDTLLTEKSLVCSQHQIALSFVADGESVAFMDPIDLYTVLSNILDNAIESVIRLPDPEQRIVTLRIFQRAGVAFIQEENCYIGELVMADGLPVTTKADQDYHGYGIKSIRAVVEKYKGLLRISTKGQRFELHISLPAQLSSSAAKYEAKSTIYELFKNNLCIARGGDIPYNSNLLEMNLLPS